MDKKIDSIIQEMFYLQHTFNTYKKGMLTTKETSPTVIKYPITFKDDNKKEHKIKRH